MGESSPPPGTYTQISVGDSEACGVHTDGTVECWGYSDLAPPSFAYTQVATSLFYACGVRTDGTVDCWGGYPFPLVGPPAGAFNTISVAGETGGNDICGTRTDGTVVCWGLVNRGMWQDG